MTRINRPGAPANPPQHILTEEELPLGGDIDRTQWKHKQTSADPHPSDEESPYRARHPGGANPPIESRDIGPNDAAHPNSMPPPRPRNAENT